MAQPNNLDAIQQDVTTAYFNNVSAPNFIVSSDVDGSVITYFEKITANKTSARLMARAVIYTAKSQNLDPMEIIRRFSVLPNDQMSAYLAMFLNLNRVSTSLLGLSNAPPPSKYVERAILP